MDDGIWRRVVQDLDKLSVNETQTLSNLIGKTETGVDVDGRRTTTLYRMMSEFWVGYWTVCEADKPKHKFCQQWLKSLERDPDADYPVEVVELLFSDERDESANDTG
jgi:hypothetical protein